MFENKVRLVFGWLSFSVAFFTRFLDNYKEHLPDFLCKPLKYGKFASLSDSYVWANFEIPKSWYRHFYAYSCSINLYTLVLTARIYFLGDESPSWLIGCLDFLGGHNRQATVNEANALLAIGMITVQILRRLYESHYVSVFSENSKMNMYHFVLSIIHYTGVIVAVLVEAPGFIKHGEITRFRLDDLNKLDYLALALFSWAWYHQKQTTAILGDLRKDPKGEIVTEKYRIPEGDWFEYLSSPHFVAEILMYFSIATVLAGNYTWTLVFLWVLANQCQFAIVTDMWYKGNFKDYPKNRYVLIPFVY